MKVDYFCHLISKFLFLESNDNLIFYVWLSLFKLFQKLRVIILLVFFCIILINYMSCGGESIHKEVQ